MTREEQLKYCKICKNQKHSMNLGVICRHTNRIADFQITCELFEEDIDLVSRLKRTKINGIGNHASSGKRFANLILDTIFYLIIYSVFLVIVFLILNSLSPSNLNYNSEDNPSFFSIIVLITMFLYYSILETLTGRTIAKYITGTKVVNEKGEKPSFKAILLRTICRFIPFEYFSYLGDDNSGLHDSISKTKVIDA